jgi:hypothetical protein
MKRAQQRVGAEKLDYERGNRKMQQYKHNTRHSMGNGKNF